MHWTPDDVVKVINAVGALIIALVAAIFSGVAAWQAHRGNETTKKVAASIESKVDEVHACLSDAREETRNSLEGVKIQANRVAEAAKEREAVK